MKTYSVIIIGGGASGLSCAMTIGSAIEKLDELKDKSVLIIDAGKSHMNAAKYYNVAGVTRGTVGVELLQDLRERAMEYPNISLVSDTATKVSETDQGYKVETSDETYQGQLLVFATGMAKPGIEGIGADVIDHIRAPRPGMKMIDNQNGQISDAKYVTGCAAGATSMFSAAVGYGAQTGTDIISSWLGHYTVIHDKK
jgi:predicted flavoprotein YhiN